MEMDHNALQLAIAGGVSVLMQAFKATGKIPHNWLPLAATLISLALALSLVPDGHNPILFALVVGLASPGVYDNVKYGARVIKGDHH